MIWKSKRLYLRNFPFWIVFFLFVIFANRQKSQNFTVNGVQTLRGHTLYHLRLCWLKSESFRPSIRKSIKNYEFKAIRDGDKKYCLRVIASLSGFVTIWSQPAAPGLKSYKYNIKTKVWTYGRNQIDLYLFFLLCHFNFFHHCRWKK